jgi:hypothetical protein
MQSGSSETLIGWKYGKTIYVPLWDRMEGAWLWTQRFYLRYRMVVTLVKAISLFKLLHT